MSNRFGLLSVKNAELLAGLSRLVQRGNELTAEVLAHLAELEERRLHLQLGFPSLFAYCVEALGLSEGAAGRRVAAARVCRRFPEAFELVACGDLHLSALRGLAPHLDARNASELFTTCCRKTRRQVDELLAARFPKPDIREQIRRLPVRGRASAAGNDPRIFDRAETRDEAVAKPGSHCHGDYAAPVESAKTAEISDDCGSETARSAAPHAAHPPAPGRAPSPASPPPRGREIEPLSAGRFGVRFTADVELRELLERARALASHRLPTNDLASLMRVVLGSFVKHEEARRFAVGRNPPRAKADATQAKQSLLRATPPGGAGPSSLSGGPESAAPLGEAAPSSPSGGAESARASGGKAASVVPAANEVARVVNGLSKRCRRSRYIPAAVRRAVHLRDDGQCSFVSDDGRRCEARALLELDHVEPWARLGGAGVENIRLRCRAHNQLHARECFGARHIEAQIAARRRGAVPSSGEM
jgi:hypothetical protein